VQAQWVLSLYPEAAEAGGCLSRGRAALPSGGRPDARRRAEEALTLHRSLGNAYGFGDDEPAVDPNRFLDEQHARWPGHWAAPPSRWSEIPEEALFGRETLAALKDAIAELPMMQRRVIELRDVEGWSSDEVCDLLGISDGNQRVLLHRARSKVRQALEDRLG
jgi:RNA polymerase sigma-70 factor (ECF subfamily)